jgi:hypothetical protein
MDTLSIIGLCFAGAAICVVIGIGVFCRMVLRHMRDK